MYSLDNKVVVITGAASGIGRATAQLFASEGARLHLVDVTGDAVRDVAAGLPGATAYEVDCSDPDAMQDLADKVFATEGAVDVLFNNAGIGHGGDIEHTQADDWRRVIEVNVLGVAYGVQAFAPRMLTQGRPARIINTASSAGLGPVARMAPYCTSKFAVVGMSESLHAELAPRGIKVSAICPGIINTPNAATAIVRGSVAEAQEQVVEYYRKRGASAESVAQAVRRTLNRHRLIVTTPRSQVDPPYLLHRASPRLFQPVARNLFRLVSGGH